MGIGPNPQSPIGVYLKINYFLKINKSIKLLNNYLINIFIINIFNISRNCLNKILQL